MNNAAREATTFAVAALVSISVTPLAIRVALKTSFIDHPRGYKGHRAPTPYLGGASVVLGFLVAAVAIGGVVRDFSVLLVCVLGLWALGTVDDRITVRPLWRVLLVTTVAVGMWSAGLGWSVFNFAPADCALTVVWVLGFVNACNLFDNIDGACATVSGASAGGAGVVALAAGDVRLAALAFAVSGACAGFLPYNLARPARIFLGDGGSMPLGLVVAGLAMLAADREALGGSAVLVGAMLAGLFVLDTTLVVVSRRRRRIPLVTGGRDHLTHRLLARLGSTRKVAFVLGLSQALLCGAAIAGAEAGWPLLGVLASLSVFWGVAALILLESTGWRPDYVWYSPESATAAPVSAGADLDSERSSGVGYGASMVTPGPTVHTVDAVARSDAAVRQIRSWLT